MGVLVQAQRLNPGLGEGRMERGGRRPVVGAGLEDGGLRDSCWPRAHCLEQGYGEPRAGEDRLSRLPAGQ